MNIRKFNNKKSVNPLCRKISPQGIDLVIGRSFESVKRLRLPAAAVLHFVAIFLAMLLLSTNVLAADPGHPASSVSAGTFETGDFIFPGNLSVTRYLIVNNTLLYVDPINGRVGIGTASPGVKLEVNGDIMAGTNNKIGFRYNPSDDTFYNYITANGANPLTLVGGMFTENGASEAIRFTTRVGEVATPAMSILNNGNVGIGTTVPSYKLDITQNSGISPYAPTLRLHNTNTGGTGSKILLSGTNGGTERGFQLYQWNYDTYNSLQAYSANLILGSENTAFTIGKSTTSTIGDQDTFSSWVTMKNGNVGIGTTAPGAKLHVRNSSATDVEIARFDSIGDSGSIQGKTYLGLHHWVSGTYPSVRIGVEEDGVGSYDASLVLQTRNSSNDVVPTTRMVINKDGNVGIGTTTPGQKLTVNGTANISGATYLLNSKCPSGQYLTADPTSGLLSCATPSGAGNVSGSGSANYVTSWTNGTNLGTGTLWQNSTNVGIGTTSPGYKLDVSGDIRTTGAALSSPVNDMTEGTSGNLAPNPSFEMDAVGTWPPSGWTIEANGGGQVVEDIGIPNTTLGRKAAYFPAGNYKRIISNYAIPAIAGQTFYGRIYYRGTAAGGGALYFGMYWSDGTYTYFCGGLDGGTSYTRCSGSLTVPAGVTSGRIWIFNYNVPTDDIYIDDVFVGNDGLDVLGNAWVSGNVGIGTIAPLSKLSINGGLHVGGDSDAGDNNALIDGTLGVTGLITSTGGITGGAASHTTGAFTGTITANTVTNALLTNAESWIGPSSTTGVYFKGGNVGIGTTSPGAGLHINVDGKYPLYLQQADSANGYGASIYFNNTGTGGRVYGLGVSSNQNSVLSGGKFYLYDINSSVYRLVLDNAGNVGIGTTVPGQKLTVNGTANISGATYLLNSKCPSGQYLTADPTTGLLSCATPSGAGNVSGSGSANYAARWTNGTNLGTGILWQNSTNVGIGTTTPNVGEWGSTLTVYGSGTDPGIITAARDASVVGYGTGYQIVFDNSAGTPTIYAYYNGFIINNTAGAENGGLGLNTRKSGIITEQVRIDNNGNVGIGTTAPGQKLTVNGTANISGATYLLNSKCPSGQYLTADSTTGLLSCATPSGSGNISGSGSANYVGRWTNGTNLGTGKITDDNTIVAVDTSDLFINTSSGNVGIGTVSPEFPLEISRTSSTRAQISLYSAGDVPNDLFFGNNGQKTRWSITSRSSAESGGYPLIFYRNNSGWLDVMTLRYDTGNVGIGTTSPGQKLVVGSGNIDVLGPSKGLRLGASDWSNGGLTYGHIITDNSTYKALMIVGNEVVGNSGKGREVKVWDFLYVQGQLSTTGSVGIGTIAPGQLLTVAGTGNITGAMYLGNSKCPSGQVLTSDATTGLISCVAVGGVSSAGGWTNTSTTTSTSLDVNVDSGTLFVNSTSGKVGIGTTTATQKLDVNGGARIGQSTLSINGDSVMIETSTTNYIANDYESSTSGIGSDSPGYSVTISSDYAFFGYKSIKWLFGGSGSPNIYNFATGSPSSTNFTVTIYVRRADGTAVTGLSMYIYIGADSGSVTPTITSVGNGWYKVVGTRTVGTAGTLSLTGLVGLDSTQANYIDGWQAEVGPTASSYVFGTRNYGDTIVGGRLQVLGGSNSTIYGNLGIGTTSPNSKLTVSGGNMNMSTGNITAVTSFKDINNANRIEFSSGNVIITLG